MLETRAEFLVNIQQILELQALAIRRVDNHYRRSLRLDKILDVTTLYLYDIAHHR